MSNLVDPSGAPIDPEMTLEDVMIVVSTRMPAPNALDFERGRALYAETLKTGITLSMVEKESIWATFFGVLGAVERLQRKVFEPKLPNLGGKSRLKAKRTNVVKPDAPVPFESGESFRKAADADAKAHS